MARRIIQFQDGPGDCFIVLSDDGLLWQMADNGTRWIPFGPPLPQPEADRG